MLERKKINKVFFKLIEIYTLEDYKKIKELELNLRRILNKYPKLDKSKQTYILKYLNLIIKIENEVVIYIQDKNLDAPILNLLNEFMLNNDINLNDQNNVEIFLKLITTNLNAKKLISYNNLMSKYFDSLSLNQKAICIKNVITNTSGELQLSLIDNLKQNILKQNFKIPSDLKLIADLLNISRNIMIDFNLDKIVLESFEYAFKQEVLGEKTIYFMQEMQHHNQYITRVNEWLVKNINTKTNDILKQRITIMYNIMLQQAGEKGERKIIYTNKPDNYAAVYYDFFLMQSDINLKKEYVSKQAIATINSWTKELLRNENIDKSTNQLVNLYKLKNLNRFLNYHALFNIELNKVPYNEELSKELIFFINDYSLVNASLALPILIQAKKDGYFITGTSPNFIEYHETNDNALNQLISRMQQDSHIETYKNDLIDFDYEIDITNKSIIVDGFNIYQPIFEVITRYQFTYFLNFETDAWVRAKVYNYILYFKRIFNYCDQLFNYCQSNDKKIRFITNGLHIPHAAAYRIYCEYKGYKANMEFIALSPGYDNYFKNVGDALTETITLLNMNTNPNSRNAFLGTKEGFDKFYTEELPNMEKYRNNAKQYLSFNRSHLESKNHEKNEILKIIQDYKTENKKVILVNGKVVFDLCVKYTKGLCHDDMSDWLTHTVEIAKKNPNILLLLKPHPHEQRKDLTMTDEPVFTFKDLVTTDIDAPNIIYLNPSLFKNDELLPYVDLGIVWNGTSCLEFLAQGIKTIAMDDWALKDYPIGMKNIKSKQEYENILNNPDLLNLPADISDKAIMFLNYMGSNKVAYPNIYTKTSTLNYHQFTNTKIFSENIDKLIKYGDPNIEELVKKVVE